MLFFSILWVGVGRGVSGKDVVLWVMGLAGNLILWVVGLKGYPSKTPIFFSGIAL